MFVKKVAELVTEDYCKEEIEDAVDGESLAGINGSPRPTNESLIDQDQIESLQATVKEEALERNAFISGDNNGYTEADTICYYAKS